MKKWQALRHLALLLTAVVIVVWNWSELTKLDLFLVAGLGVLACFQHPNAGPAAQQSFSV